MNVSEDKEQARSSGRRCQRCRLGWLAVMLAGMMAMPLVMACGEDDPGPPQRDRSRGSDEEPAETIDMSEFDNFDDVEEYSRPEYPVRRNPFRPDVEVMGRQTAEAQEEEMRPVDPLEQYAISSLRLVTIISETTVPRAMFVDPTGLGHFAKEGDRIGRNNGVIRMIRQNEVEIREGDEYGAATIVRMQEEELRIGEEGLSEEEEDALRRLLETESGRQALERSFREARASEDESSRDEEAEDGRFPGLAPPGQN